MPTSAIDELAGTVRDTMRDTRDAMSVSRVFGEAYRIGDRTLVPVATIAGGAGGGGGEQGDHDREQPERGVGGGFGLTARALGVYEVDADGVTWRPAVDVQRVVRGGQLLVGLLVVCVTILVARRR